MIVMFWLSGDDRRQRRGEHDAQVEHDATALGDDGKVTLHSIDVSNPLVPAERTALKSITAATTNLAGDLSGHLRQARR